MIISVDFDGVLHTGMYPTIGADVSDAVNCLRALHNDGHYIILNTCRQGVLLIEAINWLLQNEVPFDRVNDNNPQNTARYGSNSRKIYADVYIDDKQVGGLPDWHKIYEYINKVTL